MIAIRATMAAACLVALSCGGAAAQGWAPSRGAFARFGLVSEVCRSDGHTSLCLALACRAGQIELVSVAGGGGPMEGTTAIRFGDRTVQAAFVWDDRAVDAIGIAASRAPVARDVLEAMAGAREIELSAPSAGDVPVHRFSTRNLAAELPRAAAACARGRARRS